MDKICETCKFQMRFRGSHCAYWMFDRTNPLGLVPTSTATDTNPMTEHPFFPDGFGCNEWKEKAVGPFRIKGQGVQFFDGKFWAESAWSSENLEGWLNRMWARNKESAIWFDISTATRGRYQPVIRIGERVFPIGKCFYCEINAEEWIDNLKEDL